VEKASKVIGMAVKNLQDEKLGKVDNLMVDIASGRIVQVIISSGGFLGLGDELSAVPPAAFRFNAERDEVRLDVTKDALAKAPHFKGTDWSTIDSPVYVDSVYRAYRVEPYFSTNTMHDADNTSRNVRDRNDNTLTPLDQGSSDADVDLTRRIRKDILARDGLSANARNIKIITVNGRVTLRGPVSTEEEKRLIGDIATGAARAGSVDNQIEVERK
jgi:sporulation protein YlmC with PRC-barrel domain